LLTQGMGTFDEKERFALFDKAQQIYEHDQPWVLLVNQNFQLPMSKKLGGFVWYTDNHVHYEHLKPAE
jgi:ABC-type transport system substrate-binding protein